MRTNPNPGAIGPGGRHRESDVEIPVDAARRCALPEGVDHQTRYAQSQPLNAPTFPPSLSPSNRCDADPARHQCRRDAGGKIEAGGAADQIAARQAQRQARGPTILIQRSPQHAYRRIDFDALVEASDSAQLVAMCFEQVIAAVGTAIFAHDRKDIALCGQTLTRALSAVVALRLGISGDCGVTEALHQIYEGAGLTILDSIMDFDALALSRMRDDLREVAAALTDKAPPAASQPAASNPAAAAPDC